MADDLPKVFDIKSANDLFRLAEKCFKDYCDKSVRETKDVILIAMIVNHLREWIAPKYNPRRPKCGGKPTWPPSHKREEQFSKCVYESSGFDVVRSFCNGTKHAKAKMPLTESEPYVLTGSHPDVKVIITDGGKHLLNGKPFEEVVGPLMDKYRSWFADTHRS